MATKVFHTIHNQKSMTAFCSLHNYNAHKIFGNKSVTIDDIQHLLMLIHNPIVQKSSMRKVGREKDAIPLQQRIGHQTNFHHDR